MHILITGGSGFIGRAFATDCLRDGHRVTVLSRKAAAASAVLPSAVRIVESLDATDEADIVVNLAGENLSGGRWTAARKTAFRSSRIATTQKLVDWCAGAQRPPRLLISASAIGYYGSCGEAVLDEDSPPGEDFSARLCRDWEATASAAEGLGLRVCYVRLGIVLAPYGGALGRMLPTFRAGLGGRLGSGRQWMSWIDLADLLDLFRWLMHRDHASGVYNATAPQPVRNAEFVAALGRALHRPALLPVPAFALRLMFGEMSDLLLGSQRVLPTRALAQGFRFRNGELAAALRRQLSAF